MHWWPLAVERTNGEPSSSSPRANGTFLESTREALVQLMSGVWSGSFSFLKSNASSQARAGRKTDIRAQAGELLRVTVVFSMG